MSNNSDNRIADRYNAFFEADFMPLVRHEQTQGAPERAASADEYAAYLVVRPKQMVPICLDKSPHAFKTLVG